MDVGQTQTLVRLDVDTEEASMTRVVVSPGYGAGLSTWTSIPADDAELVAIVQLPLEQRKAAFKARWPDEYAGGVADAVVQDVPYGSWWKITEYDGSESLHVVTSLEDAGYTVAQG